MYGMNLKAFLAYFLLKLLNYFLYFDVICIKNFDFFSNSLILLNIINIIIKII